MIGNQSLFHAPRTALLVLIALGLAAPCSWPGPSLPGTAQAATKQKSRLSATRYYTLAPFTLPLFEGDDVVEQMTLVIALELTSDDKREEVSHIVPKIRDALYRELYAMVTFRRKGAPEPDVDMFKTRLYRAIRATAGEKLVKTLLVQQAFKRPAR